MWEKMVQHWIDKQKEREFAHKWNEQWGQLSLTHVEANADPKISPLCGGIPCDNITVERGNWDDKEQLNYQRSQAVLFLM